jgi:putative SOS response-associated peptidase YedK
VWPGSPFLRCQRDQAGLLDPAAPAHPELGAHLERRADRPTADRSLRYEGGRAQSGLGALGPRALLGQGYQVGFSNINAKAEEIENRPAFREALQRRRCLVPVDNFYEWKKTATGKQPYAIALADRGLMALAGLWENWRSPAGEWVRSVAIVTTEPNALCTELHDRMPVVLGPETWPARLGEEPAGARQLKGLLAPYPSEEMVAWPVSARVGNVKNNDPSPIEPIVGTG